MFSRTLLVILLGTLVPPVKASDLTSMLSLSRDITNKPPSWRFDVDPCQWQAVVCNATGSVTGIDWASLGLGGFANLTILPAGLSFLDLNSNQLTGTPDLAHLPAGLSSLDLYNNQLTGTPDLAHLPAGLSSLDLNSNQLTGTPDLAHLPAGLSYLYLNNNQLTGNGTFSSPHVWCSQQLGMCGVGTPGVFNCTSGVWRCGAAW